MTLASNQFQIGVFVYVVNSSNEVLLVRDATRERKWSLPGGGLNNNELVTTAAIRELHEELAIDIVVDRLSGIFSQRKQPGIVVLFDAHIESGTHTPDGKETSDFGYFSLRAISDQDIEIKPAQHSMICQRHSVSPPAIIFNFF
jgi:ADP-ribose pyrophosphatase YjhB (NUDIX family)